MMTRKNRPFTRLQKRYQNGFYAKVLNVRMCRILPENTHIFTITQKCFFGGKTNQF